MSDGNVSRPTTPKFTRLAGEALWQAVLDRYELEQHELVLLREIVRCVDDLDRLANIASRQGAITTAGGIHPAVAEARQMRMVLATLVGALRLPDERDADQTSLRRPHRYPPVRSIDPPTPQAQSARIDAHTDGTSALPIASDKSDKNAAPLRAKNPRRDLSGAPASPPFARRFHPAPAAQPPAAQSQQITVAQLLAKIAGNSGQRRSLG